MKNEKNIVSETLREIFSAYMVAVNKHYEGRIHWFTQLPMIPYPNISEAIERIFTRKAFPLGYCNGWSKCENDLYSILQKMVVAGSCKSYQVGRCISESSFDVTDGVDTLTITHGCDSSD